MDDVIQYQDQFYILATSSLLQERRHVLKDGDSFAVFDMQGDVAPFGAGEQGYFHGGTRHLSLLRQTINGQRPLLLSSRVREQNDLFGADLTNPDQVQRRRGLLPARPAAHLPLPVPVGGALVRAAPHRELRRAPRRAPRSWSNSAPTTRTSSRCGASDGSGADDCCPPSVDPHAVRLAYEGLDGALRATVLLFDPAPTAMTGDHARFHLELAPHQVQHPDA